MPKRLASAGPSPSSSRERLLFIDGLRCIAVLWVVLYHFTHNSPFGECFTEKLPSCLYAVAWNGYLGVEIFFVISGFVIALSLTKASLTPRFVLGFAIRRYVRLFPPYIAAVFLWMCTTFLGNTLIPSYALSQPSLAQLGSHFLYLPNILGLDDIVAPTWTLCLEFQFYLFYAVCALLIGSGGRMRRWFGIMLFGLTTLASLSLTVFHMGLNGFFHPHNFFLGTWYLFVFGVLAAFAWIRPDTRCLMFFSLLIVLVLWFFVHDKALLVGIATFALVLVASSCGRMG